MAATWKGVCMGDGMDFAHYGLDGLGGISFRLLIFMVIMEWRRAGGSAGDVHSPQFTAHSSQLTAHSSLLALFALHAPRCEV
jgi:hypothetical protein